MEKGQKEAKIGLDSEKDIITMINEDKKFKNSLKNCLSYLCFDPKENFSAEKAEKNDIKTDIVIKMNNQQIGISIKSSTKTSFHQLDRRRLENWKKLLNMPDEIFEIIKRSILRVSQESKNKFILENDRDKIKNFFSLNLEKILNEIFKKGEKSLKLLMINDKPHRKIYVYDLNEVIGCLYKNISNNIKFSNKGIIRLGDFITIQRKGGNGKHIKVSKTDWSHPGNQLQFKFSPLRFAEYVVKEKVIKFCLIEY